MCTLSWCHAPGDSGYHLFFNRDERKTREAADPPALSEVGGVPIITPRDGRSGGTWLLANAHGLSVALLNHYQADTAARRPENPTSRGQLVLQFGACRDVAEFSALVPARQRTGRYPPFLLFAIDPSGAVALWRWDGEALVALDLPEDCFLTTSSFRPADVLATREAERAKLGAEPAPEALRALHSGHDLERPESSIRMRREDSQTVSLSEIAVRDNTIRFRYRPEAADDMEELPVVDTSLTRA